MKIKKVLLLVILIVGFCYFFFQNQLAPASSQNKEIDFVVSPGQSLTQISADLKQNGLIKNAAVFRLYVTFVGLSRKIQAGLFKLSPDQTSQSIAQKLTLGALDVWVTIPEGWRVEEIARQLEEKLDIKSADFLNYAEEGFMFPDTYLIPKQFDAKQIANLMRENFNAKFDQNLTLRLKETGFSQKQVVIMASMVEREVKFSKDRPVVAGILVSRLSQDIPLQIDATVQYAIGTKKDAKNYWPAVSAEDLKINSPYNTYQINGLPPGPIASPGIDSIKAVLFFQKTDYLYYLSDKKGNIYYAKTLEEHNQNINKHL